MAFGSKPFRKTYYCSVNIVTSFFFGTNCLRSVFLLFLVLSNVKKAKEEISNMNEECSFISKSIVQEERNLLQARIKEEEESKPKTEEAPTLNDTQFSKLEELLTQTQLYSEFLLEKMDDITLVFS